MASPRRALPPPRRALPPPLLAETAEVNLHRREPSLVTLAPPAPPLSQANGVDSAPEPAAPSSSSSPSTAKASRVDATTPAVAVAAAATPATAVEHEIRAFLDAFESASVSEFAWISTSLPSSSASTVSVSASLSESESIARTSSTTDAPMMMASSPSSTNRPQQQQQQFSRQESSTVSSDRLSVDSMQLDKVGDVYLFLLELQQKLKSKQAFRGEEERTKWWWLVHQLKQQRVRYPEKWDGRADAHLVRIEVAITNLPLEHDDPHSGGNGAGGETIMESSSSSTELRISIGDIPMLESNSTKAGRPYHNQRMSVEGEEDTSWANFSRIVRAASGRTMRAFIGSNDRDSELYSTGNSGGGGGSGRGTRSWSGGGGGADGNRDSIPTLQRASGSFSQSVPNLLRSVVSYLGLSMEETFMCQICFEYVSLGKSFQLSKCGHLFCEACLENYLQFKIGEGQVYPTCFHENEGEPACSAEIVPEDIRAVVSKSSWEKYLKFKFNKENENARQCPFCDHSQVYKGSEAPECICEDCGGEFCFVHSTAHRGRSCAEYEKKIVAIEKLNHAMINEISKPCPGCNNFVEKIGGCNQMKCVVCSTSFCWICREIIDDAVFPEHFQVPNNHALCTSIILDSLCSHVVYGAFTVVEYPRMPRQSDGGSGGAVDEPDRVYEAAARTVLPGLRATRVRARSGVHRALLLLRAMHEDVPHDLPQRVHDVSVRVRVPAARAIRTGTRARVLALLVLRLLVQSRRVRGRRVHGRDPRREHPGDADRRLAEQRLDLPRVVGVA